MRSSVRNGWAEMLKLKAMRQKIVEDQSSRALETTSPTCSARREVLAALEHQQSARSTGSECWREQGIEEKSIRKLQPCEPARTLPSHLQSLFSCHLL